MKWGSKFFRLISIQMILARYSVDRLIFTTPWLAPFHFLSYLNPWNWRRHPQLSRGTSLRLALEALGPIFVKFGQMLSTRRDLLPPDIADELALLQDQVPPFSSAAVLQIIQQAYGNPAHIVFKHFSENVLASASIAQVHEALTHDNKKVVVKILRPGIRKKIERDVALLYSLASIIEKWWRDGPRFHPREVVAEFERSLLDELDLMREAANASQLRRNFADSNLLYVPEIEWSLTRTNIMVMEQIYGVRISLIDELHKRAVNMKRLAEMGVEIFFTQVFRDCFFHADMHPGNIFVDTTDPNYPKYVAVDFGIMGTLNPTDQRYLAENFLAFFKRDYRRVAELHVASGWVPYETRVDEFESAIRTVCEPIFEKPLQDISYGQVLLRLFQTARRFNMEIQPQLVLLQKTLINVEGLGRQLYPALDLWSTAKPFLERWLRSQIGFRGSWRKWRQKFPFMMEKFADMPELVYNSLQFVQTLQIQNAIAKRDKQKSPKKFSAFLTGCFTGVVVAVGGLLLLKALFLKTV